MTFGRDYRNSDVEDMVRNCDDEAVRKLELEDGALVRKQFGGIQDEVNRSCDDAQFDNHDKNGNTYEQEVEWCRNVRCI